jgi:hypothetical protein
MLWNGGEVIIVWRAIDLSLRRVKKKDPKMWIFNIILRDTSMRLSII